MDVSNEWEIHIPVEAEVMNIPLWSLPNSVLRRIGLPVSDSDTSRKLADSPRVIWICPAVVERKRQGAAPREGNNVAENMRSLLGTEFRSRLDPMQMSFVSRNRAAWEVLKEPGKQTHHSRLLPQSSAPADDQNAVVIYHGRIYLCIRRSMQSRGQPGMGEPQSAISSGLESSSDSPEKEIQRGGKHKGKPATGEAKQHVKRGAALKRKGVASVRAAHPAPQPCSSEREVDSCSVKVARREQALDDYIQHHEEQRGGYSSAGGEYELQDPSDEGASWNHVSDSSVETDGDQSSGRTWATRESLGAAATAASLRDFDFSELAREEEIAQKMANLDNLLSS